MANLYKKITYLSFIACMITLGGCATNANSRNMVYQPVAVAKPKNPALVNNITVMNVTGGEETNPLWLSKIDNSNFKMALEQSLQQSNLYNQTGNARYHLNATLIKLHQPFMGLNMTVSSEVKYNVEDQKTHREIYNKDILATYTAEVSDSLIGVERLKLATEGAAKANIQKFIEDLLRAPSR